MQRIYLVLKEMISGRFISIIVFCAVSMSVITVGFFGIIGDNLNNYINKRFASSIAPNTIKVSPRQGKSFFFFQVKDPGNKIMTDGMLRRFRRLGGVKIINPVLALKIPMQARGTVLGTPYRTDLLAFGIPYRLIKGDIASRALRRLWLRPEKGRPLPVLVPRSVLRAYNDGMADQNSLPRISEKGAIGLQFIVLFGRSSLKSLEGYEKVNAVVSGFTDKVNTLALLVPLQSARRFNRKFVESYRPQYQHAFITVRDHRSLLRVSEKIRAMGFDVEAEGSLSKKILLLKRNIGIIVTALQYIIIMLSVMAVSFAAIIATLNRVEYYRVMRIVGSSKLFITITVFFKYMAVGFLGAWGGMKVLNAMALYLTGVFNLTGVVLTFSLSEKTYKTVLIYGTLIPVLSTIPALFRLYLKDLGRD